ncbi:methylamine utilization protein [Pseudomonas sp. MDMC216]|nr:MULTISPECIES: methylamine utilization protein [unclassified Pseudomonas]MBA4683080.1 methylamine utilization protein [Pseudomonas sp.]MDI5992819.1 methylamine utilization protein [Pseudomonas sp. MDMC216]MDI6007294.1 methylamine utilization protein [Pseudomonas sp. MDMC17]RAR40071.1 methylamine utilization protein [Pseudomonas sp. MDMC224]
MTGCNSRLLPLVLFAAVVLPCLAHAAALQAELVDAAGQPLADAVISLRGPLHAPQALPPARMDQRNKQFQPHVLAVRTGTSVSFPNSDDIRHQVYSFSPAKRFELRLYQGTPSDPVLFDKPGLVVLGCNIHDWMLGYIYVTDDPWFAVSDEHGRAAIAELPAGRYAVTLWHPGNPQLLPQAAGELQFDAQASRQRFVLASSGPAESPAPPAPSAFGEAFRKAAEDAAQ